LQHWGSPCNVFATYLQKISRARYGHTMEQQLHDSIGISQLETFLNNETGLAMDDGSGAVASLQTQLWKPQNHEGESSVFIHEDGQDLGNGLVELYGPDVPMPIGSLQKVLSGSFVVASLTPEMSMPAIVATNNKQTEGSLTFYMMQKKWRASGLTADQETLLAAAAQLETPSAGQHQASDSSSSEAQHLLTQFGITDKPRLLSQWRQGVHINHSPDFINKGTLASISDTVFPNHAILTGRIRRNPAGTTELSLNNSPYRPAPHFSLLWHQESMVAENEQGIKVGDQERALVIAQGAGFLAVQQQLPALRQTLLA